jgi:hypothetical protein
MTKRRIRTPLDQAIWEARVTNRWLGEQIGAHETQVSRWRHGLHVPEQATREAIARALGREVNEIWPVEREQEAA